MRSRIALAALSGAFVCTLALTTQAQNRIIDVEFLRNAGATFQGVGSNDWAGWSVDGAGDVDNDGKQDIIVGAPEDPLSVNDTKGNAYIILGTNTLEGDIALSGAAVTMTGAADEDEAGYSVAGAGDVYNDGFVDVIVGAWRRDGNGNNSGEAYLIYGADPMPAAINLGSIATGVGVTLTGRDNGDLAGQSVAGAGDVNNDGFDDIIIGANAANPVSSFQGEAYVVYGGSSLPDDIDLSTLNGTTGFIIRGVAGARIGSSVDGAGDVDNDGFDDVLVGAPEADPNGKTNAGSAFLIYGGSSVAALIDLASLGSQGVQFNGATAGDRLGSAVLGAGKVNGGSLPDILLSASTFDDGATTDAGRCYLIYGSAGFGNTFEVSTLGASSAGAIFTGEGMDDKLGTKLAAGDMNRDGRSDLLMAAFAAGAEGRIYLVHGGSSIPATLDLDGLDERGVVFKGIDSGDFLGEGLGFAGDVDGDGSGDFLFGARFADPSTGTNAGEAYLVKGGCNFLQAAGPVAVAGTFEFRAHGTPSTPYLLWGALSRTVDPIASGIGPFWLEVPLIDLWILSFGTNGEASLSLPVPNNPNLSGVSFHMQTIQEGQGKLCDLTYVMDITIL